ncbi:MAG TPA: NAD(P)H-dependent glycerol-3-phosphate dehydrogenase [Chitinophagaceae bacterium]|nr:NAD(P)H-dependent glycerol-3-phosphate dehydrogenase [Chitinophagaceae bacterium]HEX5652820.1 NAD(P)H-dependent glycerol-3-phosphate dehydrogenase [Chitinophagaceae bacterium]
MRFGIIGSGSWATALAKILTDKNESIHWWIRNPDTIAYLQKRRHNPHYLNSANFDVSLLEMSSDIRTVVKNSDTLVIAVPSAYAAESLAPLNPPDWKNKKVVSAIKGLLPEKNILLNYYLEQQFDLALEDYFAILGPCHAEEVAAEKLSYLTISGIDTTMASAIASHFTNQYINTIVNHDILGVQYAAVMKNIYALGAGIAHGLDYGDNFLSVYIANAADEMAGFLREFGAEHITVGEHEGEDPVTHRKTPNYAASVYLGDLLVTCYSLYSRNRTFGNMIGKGYSVKAAQLEMNMVAEGYQASRSINNINLSVQAAIPIADTVYKILWDHVKPAEGFKRIEQVLV